MVSAIISRIVVVTAGTLYPAYRSFKAVRTKDVREYVKWMMYWITFALYLSLEIIADTFLSFLIPFYYEAKILFVLWLVVPYTKGASTIYRKILHPLLIQQEETIDQYLDKLRSDSCNTLLKLGNQGIVYAREAVATAAVAGVTHIHRSYSLSDVNTDDNKRRAGVQIREIHVEEEEPEEETHEEGREEQVWHGYYDNSGNLVEEEGFEDVTDAAVPIRRSGRRKKAGDPAYSTLPRASSRNRRAKNS